MLAGPTTPINAQTAGDFFSVSLKFVMQSGPDTAKNFMPDYTLFGVGEPASKDGGCSQYLFSAGSVMPSGRSPQRPSGPGHRRHSDSG